MRPNRMKTSYIGRIATGMQTNIALVRHGVTDWNYEGRAQGQSDIPLNQEGRWQVKRLGERMAKEHFDAIYSSTLSRAYETALAVAQHHGLEVVKDARLMEKNMGAAEGTRSSERRVRWPGLSLNELPGVESEEQMAARAREALTEIAERHPGQSVLCVAHGGLISAFLDSLSKEQRGFRHQRNTAVTRLVYENGQFRQVSASCHQHILVEGIEYSSEGGRLAHVLGRAEWLGWSREMIYAITGHSSSVQAALEGDELVGFLRAFTDGMTNGYIDLLRVKPGYEHVVSELVRRTMSRYPRVSFSFLGEASAYEQLR